MRFVPPLTALAVLLLTLAAPADEKDEKKSDKTDKKSVTTRPAPPKVEKYQILNTVQGQVVALDNKEMTLNLKVPAYKNNKMEWEVVKGLKIAEDAKVFTTHAPERVDKDGKPRRLTPQEEAELKDRKHKAYVSELGEVNKDANVTVEFGVPFPENHKKVKPESVKPEEKLIVTIVIDNTPSKAAPAAKPAKK